MALLSGKDLAVSSFCISAKTYPFKRYFFIFKLSSN
jgi:hypothetical protein